MILFIFKQNVNKFLSLCNLRSFTWTVGWSLCAWGFWKHNTGRTNICIFLQFHTHIFFFFRFSL